MLKSLAGMMIVGALAWMPATSFAQATSARVSKAEILATDLFPENSASGRVHTANLLTCRTLVDENVDIGMRWTLQAAFTDGDLRYALKGQRPGQNCDTGSADIENAEECVQLRANSPIGTSDSHQFQVNARTLFGFSDVADCEDRTENYDVIFVLPYIPPIGSGETKTHEPDVLRIRLLTTRPYAPGDVRVTAGQSSVFVEWTPPSEANGYSVYISPTPFSEGDVPEDVQATRYSVTAGNSFRVTSGIEANREYYVAVTTMDAAGNESLLSPVATALTVPTIDFWEDYLNNGGRETGGYCQAMTGAEGGVLALLMALGLLWRRSTERRGGSDA